jgi:TPP-dependent pyruvate/acetoin dehydrogenase alpha subunit
VEEWKKRDPIALLMERLRQEKLISDAEIETLEKKVAEEVDDAVTFSEAGTPEPVSELTRFVYSEGMPS